ncbi:hypothetical protein ABFS82_05G079100 [Erythranthe guttata]|uniref:Uncharacterized protein n=1 Tax=Erythranthe guttata TaxID=4155 RepID=A0A022RKW9_ERYGU|nr:PREDICTED: protein PHLOEM PROTEIN 2-LIKE A9-like [Erythranthe guttata]EYU40846.1 hypothetical protein MIMGU_mgv1a014064mg [Erythranthe guttata]|eukprot:XP_012833281.1 PREDICTED: protein PHLOEM PROTEIN 2-LIKE A9-like [Erythranthe guttata]
MGTNNMSTPHHAGNPSLEFKVDDKTKQMIIPARDLNIVWGNDTRYWNVPIDEGSAVELNQVCWLEVTGCVEKTSPEKIYEVGFEVSIGADAFGWGSSPLYVMVKRGKDGKFEWTKYSMQDHHQSHDHHISLTAKLMSSSKKQQQHKEDDIHDDIINTDNNNNAAADEKIYFGLYEVWSGKWKGGLKIHHAFVHELPATTTTN